MQRIQNHAIFEPCNNIFVVRLAGLFAKASYFFDRKYFHVNHFVVSLVLGQGRDEQKKKTNKRAVTYQAVSEIFLAFDFQRRSKNSWQISKSTLRREGLLIRLVILSFLACSLSLSPLSLSPCLSFSLPPSVSLSVCPSLSFSLSLCPSLSLSVSLCLSLTLSLPLSLSLSFSLSFSLFLSLSAI